jgi:putative transposase
LGRTRSCGLLIIIGSREDGVKELLAVEDGYRESTESWAAVFRDLKRRGLNEPRLVVGDGALGAWAALRDVFFGAGEQRCWFHASRKRDRLSPQAPSATREGAPWRDHRGPARAEARRAVEVLREEYGSKYPKALAELDRDWKPLTALLRLPRRALAAIPRLLPWPWPTSCSRQRRNAGDGSTVTSSSLTCSPA